VTEDPDQKNDGKGHAENEKKNGTLEFVSLVCEARKADGELALTIRRVLVVRHA